MGSFVDGAAKAVICYIYSDVLEWDGDNTPVQGFAVFRPVGFSKIPSHLPWAVNDWEM